MRAEATAKKPAAATETPALRADPITQRVVNNALQGVAEQMAATILRTSYSTVVREMLDYSTAVFDPHGQIIAQSCRIPIHLNSMSRSLRTTLEQAIPLDQWKPGDIIVTNDPYLGGQHIPDVQTFLPVFADGKIVAICGTLDHHLDLGGMRPASYAGDAVEIYQEGLRIPPIKLFDEGRLNERLFALIAANIRQPDQTIGDLRAQAAALEIGRDSVLELVRRYGAQTVADCMADAVDASEMRLRARLRELPSGTYEGEYYIDDDGIVDERIRVVTRITIDDGSIHVDFTGTDGQRRSPINATISSCESATYFAILSILDPTIPANYGVYKPIKITAPKGSIVNAQPPAPVVGRNAITHTIVNAIMRAFSKIAPERVTAGYYGMSNIHILSGDGTGGTPPCAILFDIEVGGGGGRRTKDGSDCYSQGIHNLANTPIEMIELNYPLRLTRYELLPDTGGAGRTRGGLGVRRDIEFLDKSGTLETQFDKFKVEPFGLFGGGPGATGKLYINPDTPDQRELKSKTFGYPLKHGDTFSMRTQGGGGYGPPAERPGDAIERDIREGKLTKERAKSDYGGSLGAVKITSLETLVIELPRRTSYTWRSLQVPIGKYVVLRIDTDEGISGLGEAPAILSWGGEHGRYYGEDPDIVCYLVKGIIAPILTGADPMDARAILARLDVDVRGFPYTKAMIESALLDIAGRALGVPVYQLLGGAIRREIPLCHSIGIAEPAEMAKEAEQVAADGVRWMQVKIPGIAERDIAIVKEVRRAVGDGISIFPDVNRGYKSSKAAVLSIQKMREAAGIVAIEQPVEGLTSMAKVAGSVDIPVIVDEGCWSPQDALEIVRHGGADLLSIYFTKSGGMYRSMQIGTVAQAAGLPVNVNGSLEGGVGNAANLHLVAALEGEVWPAIITVNTLAGREQSKVAGVFYTDDIITEPFEFKNGALRIPDKPGLGIELDPKKIEKYRVG